MNAPFITLDAITRLQDPLLEPWLNLYQDAFPLNEQVRFSSILRKVKSIETGEDKTSHLFAVTDAASDFIGMTWFEFADEGDFCYLWYLAVSEARRNQQFGSQILKEIVQHARQHGVRAILLEVEHPDYAHDANEAKRRIEFYRRAGGMLCVNAIYYQSVGWQPKIRMGLMVIPLVELSPDEVLTMLKSAFGVGMETPDDLILE